MRALRDERGRTPRAKRINWSRQMLFFYLRFSSERPLENIILEEGTFDRILLFFYSFRKCLKGTVLLLVSTITRRFDLLR